MSIENTPDNITAEKEVNVIPTVTMPTVTTPTVTTPTVTMPPTVTDSVSTENTSSQIKSLVTSLDGVNSFVPGKSDTKPVSDKPAPSSFSLVGDKPPVLRSLSSLDNKPVTTTPVTTAPVTTSVADKPAFQSDVALTPSTPPRMVGDFTMSVASIGENSPDRSNVLSTVFATSRTPGQITCEVEFSTTNPYKNLAVLQNYTFEGLFHCPVNVMAGSDKEPVMQNQPVVHLEPLAPDTINAIIQKRPATINMVCRPLHVPNANDRLSLATITLTYRGDMIFISSLEFTLPYTTLALWKSSLLDQMKGLRGTVPLLELSTSNAFHLPPGTPPLTNTSTPLGGVPNREVTPSIPTTGQGNPLPQQVNPSQVQNNANLAGVQPNSSPSIPPSVSAPSTDAQPVAGQTMTLTPDLMAEIQQARANAVASNKTPQEMQQELHAIIQRALLKQKTTTE